MKPSLLICLLLFLPFSVVAIDAPAVGIELEAQDAADLRALRALVALPDSKIDLAQAKIAMDRMIDPSVDAASTNQRLDALTAAIKARIPAGASSRAKLDILLSSLHQPGPWNEYRPFQYDFDDPLGTNIRNKLLSTYLDTRKGNCVSMPVLFTILGQRLGLDVHLALAPLHFLVKFRTDEGQWLNVEATGGGFKSEAGYVTELAITPVAMQNGIYLRSLSRRESVGALTHPLMEHAHAMTKQSRRIAISDFALEMNPKDVWAMIHKASASSHLNHERYIDPHGGWQHIPVEFQAESLRLAKENIAWFKRAEALGWTPTTPEQDAAYLAKIRAEKAARSGE